MTRRGRILSFGSAALLVVVGAVGAAAVSGTVGQVIALALIGFGLVLATGLVFLEVGLSEDRERERHAAAQLPPPTEREPHPERGTRPRLARLRGRRRTLM